MMTNDEILAEIAYLREVPARLRLERLMRESGGLLDMLEGMLVGVPDWVEFKNKEKPIDETLPGACGKHNGTQRSEYQKMIEAKEQDPELPDPIREPIKRKRGRPARRVENAGEA